MKPKFNIGDVAWKAHLEWYQEQVACPDCFGKKFLTVIMGDSSMVTIDCEGCSLGYEPPRGFILEDRRRWMAKEITITRVEICIEGVEYGSKWSSGLKENEIFNDRHMAEVRALEMMQEFNDEQERKSKNQKEQMKRTWSWNATYHRREIRQHEKSLAYHKAKLEVAKLKAKEP